LPATCAEDIPGVTLINSQADRCSFGVFRTEDSDGQVFDFALGFLDTYRTLCMAPPREIRQTFELLGEFAA
jgi:hypothetical protein